MHASAKHRVSRALRAKNTARRGVTTSAPSRAIEPLEGRVMFDATYHPLATSNFVQDWSGTAAAIASLDDWSGVPSILGYQGQALTNSTATDPQTNLLPSTHPTPLDIDIVPQSS